MRFTLLTQDSTLRIKGINHLTFFVNAQVASFNVFLRIVPRATTIVQEKGEDDTAHGTDHQRTSLSLGPKDDTDGNWRQYGNNTREDHSAQGAAGTDVYATGIVGFYALCGILRHNLGILSELAAYLFDHTLGSGANGANCQSAEEEDERKANQCGDKDQDIGQVNAVDRRVMFEGVEHIKVSAEEQEGCQCSRTDAVALCQRLGGVTYTVERISDVAHRLSLSAHLGDTTGIVGDGTEGVHGENIRGTHEHTHGGDSSTKDNTRVDDLWNDRRVNAYLATQEE